MPTSSEKIRAHKGSVFFERGFRPFFFSASAFAGIALPIWAFALVFGFESWSHLGIRVWHIHEMIFGFVPAVIAGFALTAIPNWTGRLPVTGKGLAGLYSLWVLGRIAMFFSAAAPTMAAMVAVLFPVVFSALVWREILAGGNKRNLPICVLITIIAVAEVGFQYTALYDMNFDLFYRMGLAGIAMLLTVIGGRVTPSFTRNWMSKRGFAKMPAPMGMVDKLAMLASALAVTSWVFLPLSILTGILFAIAAALTVFRISRWRGWQTFSEPLVAVLHVGFSWMPVWFALMALAIFSDGSIINTISALHALTAGVLGTMTLAVMSRASLGHSGRGLHADAIITTSYILVFIGALMRILANLSSDYFNHVYATSGILWALGFAVFALYFIPVFFKRRKPNR